MSLPISHVVTLKFHTLLRRVRLGNKVAIGPLEHWITYYRICCRLVECKERKATTCRGGYGPSRVISSTSNALCSKGEVVITYDSDSPMEACRPVQLRPITAAVTGKSHRLLQSGHFLSVECGPQGVRNFSRSQG